MYIYIFLKIFNLFLSRKLNNFLKNKGGSNVEVRTLLVIFLLRTPCNRPMLIEHPVDFYKSKMWHFYECL